ncbi:MAG TPA: HAD-IC family P-type ATPase, partial [Deinococcales bacterium]|nr:HAD-IC family P-type ATPase [Deinococcales bacterium]
VGRIAGLLRHQEEQRTPLQGELDRTGRRLGAVVLVLAAVMVAALLLAGGPVDLSRVLEALVLGVALAVAAVPEGLPAVVTAVLALGTQRMARRQAIIRKLPAVETLGSATVIASDKTGTLTRNEMTVRVVVTAGGRFDLPDPRDPNPPTVGAASLADDVAAVLTAADLASNAVLRPVDGGWRALGDPTEGALKLAARQAGLDEAALRARYPRIGEVPFSSERKRMSTLHDDPAVGQAVLFAKGAPDVLLPLCAFETSGGKVVPLTEAGRDRWRQVVSSLAADALRTLAVARRDLPAGDAGGEDRERDLVLLGLVGMMDPPRPEAPAAVAQARGAGLRTILITGDHPHTALAIARQLGLPGSGRAVTGVELERLDDRELGEAAREANVFARVDPVHKLRLVRALQAQGEIVAMTGDGVNDAPALRQADIGVAMGRAGSDVAKEAADMILADDNFATIVAAVEEGRAIFSNIRKFLRYLLSSNMGEVLTMFLAVVFAPLLGLASASGVILPLLAAQILWINLLTDGPPALALALDPPSPQVMRRPPRPRGEGVITGRMWIGVGVIGLTMALGTLSILDAALPGGLIEGEGSLARARSMVFTTLVLQQLFNVFNARSDERSAFNGLFVNAWLWGAIALSLALQWVVLAAPFLQVAFGTTALSAADWGLCAAVASSVLWVGEATKLARQPRRRLWPAAS